MTTILGINTESDGFSAAVVADGRVMSAVEQFKIREHWSSREKTPVPADAALTSLQAAGIEPSDVDVIAYIGDVHSAEKIIPHIRSLNLNPRAKYEPVDHRVAHSTAAFYSSPFDRAAILIADRGQEPGSLCLASGEGACIDIEEVAHRHLRLGTLYNRISGALGFHPWTSNKLAWLGVTGEPKLLDVFRTIMSRASGDPGIDELLKAVAFEPPNHVAASLQAWANEVVLGLAEDFCRRRQMSNICLAGHLAENPLLVRALEQRFGTTHMFVMPAPGRESLSVGAALARLRCETAVPPESRFTYPALGPEFSDSEIKSELDNCKLVCNFFPGVDALIESISKSLMAGSIAGWFQGRCEFGHRALGFRSIVANPFTPYIDENINRFLKHRESFHPFVISVTEESASDYFDQVGPNARTISSVYAVKDGMKELLSRFAIRNGCVRVHTVGCADNQLFWTLLRKMKSSTGHPLLINSSFNLPSEPLVMTPRDAIRSFFASGLDVLAIGRFLLTK
jgi:carbamoyltransferase